MAEEKKDKWIMGVALTTTILAVCAAISSLRAGAYSTRIQVYTTKEANSWAYYQSKSIKEHNFRLQRDIFRLQRLLEDGNPEARNFTEERLKEYDKEVSRYEKEKDEIKDQAEKLIKDQEVLKEHNSNFALAVMLLQIAILMSSVSALIRKKYMWFVGLGFGVFGLVYMANGFFLWY
jgi:heme/copper-type cytochrome/quinol oxidase subunit 4